MNMEEIVWRTSFSTRRLSEKEVLDALILAGLVRPGGKVELSFEVPSGGDYSGMRLRLEDVPLVVTASYCNEVKP